MKLFQAIICALTLSLVFSQSFPATPVQNPSGTATTAVSSTAGYLVTMANAGWAIGDALTLTTGTAATFITTLISTTGVTGVGLVAVGGNGGTTFTCNPTTAFAGLTNLEGKAPTATPASAAVPAACPVDFLTLYSGTPTTATTSNHANALTMKLIAGVPFTWTITQQDKAGSTTVSGCHGASIQSPGYGTSVAANLATANTCGSTTNEKYFYSGFTPATGTPTAYTYAFYVNAEGSAKVCFQNQAQFLVSPGACGVTTTKSSNILSVLVAPLLLVSIALLN